MKPKTKTKDKRIGKLVVTKYLVYDELADHDIVFDTERQAEAYVKAKDWTNKTSAAYDQLYGTDIHKVGDCDIRKILYSAMLAGMIEF